MSHPNAPPSSSRMQLAEQMLDRFDINDEATYEFLCSIVASGHASQEDIAELLELSVMRGVEEWDMLIECAKALRNKAPRLNDNDITSHRLPSLLPFLGLILTGQAGQLQLPDTAGITGPGDSGTHPRADDQEATAAHKQRKDLKKNGKSATRASKRTGLGRGVSRFWNEHEEASGHAESQQNTIPTCQSTSSSSTQAAKPGPESPDDGKRDGCSRATGDDRSSAGEITMGVVNENVPAFGLGEVGSFSGRPNTSRKVQVRSEPAVKAKRPAKSPFFTTPPSTAGESASASKKNTQPARGTVSRLPIPPLSADGFGIIQEELAHDPFRLLIAVTFLIRTWGTAAIPVFHELVARFPGPEAIAMADPAEITALICPLGLSVVRCNVIQKYARLWVSQPPTKEKRYGVKNYPRSGDGRHVKAGEEFGPELLDNGGGGSRGAEDGVDAVTDARQRALGSAWEIGHLTQGPYAIDSWRIFCRDVLLGRAEHWTGKGSHPGFQPEWMRVLPKDKELRACLRWMWLREGWEWDPISGDREPLREDLRRAVDEGRVGYDDQGSLMIVDEPQDGIG
ncbi:hypothetical protein B0H63DRAFT_462105 [Podospora didyma]|uniref:HhH-GPD domain-containing protein n=1 Tax=Podospora didyma TaxID=330526 RepID=A0AAE0P7N9_9PEZI|nr:hypothetical protein B0H63DRAFT_462105 [Podospora didyma]